MQRYSPLRTAQRLTIKPNCSREKPGVSKLLGGFFPSGPGENDWLTYHIFRPWQLLPGGQDLAVCDGVPILQLFGEPRYDLGMRCCHVMLFGWV